MQTYNFEIMYKRGSKMLTDSLSCNIVEAISWQPEQLQQEQDHDPLIQHLKKFLLHQELPQDAHLQSLIRLYEKDSFVEDGLLWQQIKCQLEPSWVVLFLPKTLVPDILKEVHGNLLASHKGLYKTKEQALQCNY
jgi:hypothetical protein